MIVKNKFLGFCILFVILSSSAHALIIQGIETSKDSYANGDLIELTIYTNEKGLEFTADFSKLDSGYNPGSVISEEVQDFVYKIYYPITFKNNKGSGLHNVVISSYSKRSDKSSIISYAIKIDNSVQINQTSASDRIQLKVRPSDYNPDPYTPPINSNNTRVRVEDGMIMVCSDTGCSTLTEDEYEKGRRIIISSGDVELSNLTYNQLKNQIETDVNQVVQSDLQQYINYIIGTNKKFDDALFDIKEMMTRAENNFANQSSKTENYINKGIWMLIGTIILVIIIVVGSIYTIYLKTQSTWLD
jgi:hypothetical protein